MPRKYRRRPATVGLAQIVPRDLVVVSPAGRHQELTEKQREFVIHFTQPGRGFSNAAEAARMAGYESDRNAGQIGRDLLEKPHVLAAIDLVNRRQMGGSLATKAVQVLENALTMPDVPWRVRVDAAKTVLDRAGIVSQAARQAAESEKAADDKPLSEMTRAELEEVVRKGAAVLQAAKAAPTLELSPVSFPVGQPAPDHPAGSGD